MLLSNAIVPSLSASIESDSIFFGDIPPLLNVGNDQSNLSVSYFWSAVGPGLSNIADVSAPLTNTDPGSTGFYTFYIEAISLDSCIVSDTIYLLIMN